MGPRSVVIVDVQKGHLAEMPFTKHNDVVEAFSPERANQPFRIPMREPVSREIPCEQGKEQEYFDFWHFVRRKLP